MQLSKRCTANRSSHSWVHAPRVQPGGRRAAAAAAASDAAAAPAAGASLQQHQQQQQPQATLDESLADWIRANGGSVAGARLVVSRGPGGAVDRQLQASKDLAPGDRIMTVPLQLQVRDTGGACSRLAALVARAPAAAGGRRPAWQFAMALQLIAYRLEGPPGARWEYIRHLPGVAEGVPVPRVAMLWDPVDLAQLQDPKLAADADGQAFHCREFAAGTLAALPGSPEDPFGGAAVTEELLQWGLALAMSRSFGFRRSPGHGMVPLVDMANHSFESNAEIRADESGAVTMIANKAVREGKPLLLRYGTHSNADLLLSYGFLDPSNPFERREFEFDADFVLGAMQQFLGVTSQPTPRPSDGLKTWQRGVLAEMGLLPAAAAAAAAGAGAGHPRAQQAQGRRKRPQQPQHEQGQGQQQEEQQGEGSGGGAAAGEAQPEPQPRPGPVAVAIGGDPPVSGPLLAACRVMLSEDRKAVKARTAEELGDWSKPIDPAHEAIVMKALVGLCTVLYKSLPTSIQEDTRLLAEADASAAAGGAAGSSGSSGGGGGGEALGEGARAAVEYRLAAKRALEGATRRLLVRMKELMG